MYWNRSCQFSATPSLEVTGIVPDDSQHSTYRDVGSVENAGAILCHPSLEITGIVPDDSQHTLHPWR